MNTFRTPMIMDRRSYNGQTTVEPSPTSNYPHLKRFRARFPGRIQVATGPSKWFRRVHRGLYYRFSGNVRYWQWIQEETTRPSPSLGYSPKGPHFQRDKFHPSNLLETVSCFPENLWRSAVLVSSWVERSCRLIRLCWALLPPEKQWSYTNQNRILRHLS